MRAMLLNFIQPVREEELPALRRHLSRGAPVYGRLLLGIMVLTPLLSMLAHQPGFARQTLVAGVSSGLLLLSLRYLDRSGRPENAIFAMVLTMVGGMCAAGWVNPGGPAEDLQHIWAFPVVLAAFMPWRPTYSLVLGAVILSVTGIVHFSGISPLTIPFWKVAQMTLIGTIMGATANQLQRHLWLSLEESRRQMTALDRVAGLGRLTAGLAHEVKTPIAATMNSLDSARELLEEMSKSIGHEGVTEDDLREITRELQGVVRNAATATDRVAQIIRRVREHTKGLHATTSTEFSVLDRARAVEGLVGHTLQKTNTRFDVSGVPGDVVLSGDMGKFDQILLNLVTNAVEAGSGNPRGATVTISARRDAGAVVICVQDEGPGLSAEVRERLFQPMFTTKANGTGLGLAISRELAEGAFGGTLRLVPSNTGARFELRCGAAAPVQSHGVYTPAVAAYT